MEEATYQVLIEKKILRAKGMLADGTVIPENIKYPNDVGLLNDVRQWIVKQIECVGKDVGKKYRTYCRKARQVYLNFAKSKRKTKRQIKRAKRQMLQFVRRNLKQLEEVIHIAEAKGSEHLLLTGARLNTAKKIFDQQWEMYKAGSQRIADRIVSFHRPWVRPIKRGKNGKDVEFGAKAAMSHVDGFLFLDKIQHTPFSEAQTVVVGEQIAGYEKRFGKKPASFTGDKAYGSLENRRDLEEKKIRASFVPLGKKKTSGNKMTRWFKKKQKERNRIEGHFGHAKEHYRLNRMWYHGQDGSEIWTRGGILAMNLMTAWAKM